MLRHALYNGFCCSNGMYGISRDRNVYAVYVGFCHFYVFFNLYFKENAGYKEETGDEPALFGDRNDNKLF